MKHELKLPFYLAFQSIRRGRKWTLFLTILLMAVAFINLIFISSLFNGIIDGSNKQIKNTLTGNVYMVPKEGVDYLVKKNAFLNYLKVLDKINSADGIVAATSTFNFPGRIEYKSRSGRWPIVAINPEQYAKVINVSQKMYQGKYLDENDDDQIILGRQIAGGEGVISTSTALRGIKVGDKVKVVFDNKSKTFTVKGIFDTKFAESDSRAFITEKSLRSISPDIVDIANVILIKTDEDKAEKILASVKSLRPDTETYLWTEAAGVMRSISSSFTSINVLMTIVGVIIAGVTTFIVVYVDIVNRRKQIGILRAIGIRPYIIVSNYMILALIYATLGIVLGSAIFFLGLVPYFNANPFTLPITEAVLNLKWVEYFARIQIIGIVAVISGLIPALIVTKSKMIDTIIGK